MSPWRRSRRQFHGLPSDAFPYTFDMPAGGRWKLGGTPPAWLTRPGQPTCQYGDARRALGRGGGISIPGDDQPRRPLTLPPTPLHRTIRYPVQRVVTVAETGLCVQPGRRDSGRVGVQWGPRRPGGGRASRPDPRKYPSLMITLRADRSSTCPADGVLAKDRVPGPGQGLRISLETPRSPSDPSVSPSGGPQAGREPLEDPPAGGGRTRGPRLEATHHSLKPKDLTAVRPERGFGEGQDRGGSLTAPHSPWQNPFAERLIGSIRRECLNHVFVSASDTSAHILTRYVAYDHQARTHLALNKDAPDLRPIQRPATGKIVQRPEVGGLHQRYIRHAAEFQRPRSSGPRANVRDCDRSSGACLLPRIHRVPDGSVHGRWCARMPVAPISGSARGCRPRIRMVPSDPARRTAASE